MKLGELVLPWGRHIISEKRTESPFKDIEDIALGAGEIWFSRKGRMRERYQEAAWKLLQHLTPAVISDREFYQQTDGKTHRNIIDLLWTLVPMGSDGLVEFMQGSTHEIIVSYLQGIVSHQITIMDSSGIDNKKAVADGSMESYKVEMASHLRKTSEVRPHYLDLISPIIGLPLPPKRQSPDPPVKC